MERKKWINFKKTGQIDPNWLYNYYLDNKKSDKDTLTPASFETCIQMFLGRGGQLNKFIEYWDNQHEVITVLNSNNENIVIDYV